MSKPENSTSTRIPQTWKPKGYFYAPGRAEPWRAAIMYKGKTYRKSFETEEDAHEWYMSKSYDLYGFNRFEAEL